MSEADTLLLSDDGDERLPSHGVRGSGASNAQDANRDHSELRNRLAQIDDELGVIELELSHLEARKAHLTDERVAIHDLLNLGFEADGGVYVGDGHSAVSTLHRTILPPREYYENTCNFAWSDEVHQVARERFGVREFRQGQLGIINATLSGRDVMVILPTGFGKSLCYQLPAALESTLGITLVISPLISLIQDQMFHLRELGIGVASIVGTSSKGHRKAVMDAMLSTAGKATGEEDVAWNGPLKLVYVTPEKIAKSKRFVSHLEKIYKAGRFSRICVDEAHCCSQLGHDFRPDYKKLGILKTLFPNTPTIALTATCSLEVLESVLSILGMAPTHSPSGSLLFTGPLDRQNLRYSVVFKPPTIAATITWIADWISEKYSGKCGIVYCLSKKDTTLVASGIEKASERRIRAGVYHADMTEQEKISVHKAWRDGRLHVVVATIAFGMGINAPNVRFIIHHSMSKSIDGYYQESGRAGRDGAPSECILMYRGQDASRLSTMAVSEVEGLANVYAMMRYAEDTSTCRRTLFRRFFVRDAQALSSASSSHPVGDTCGNCDHCLNADGATVIREDVTVAAATVCKILAACSGNERLTFVKLLDAWRGTGQKLQRVVELMRLGEVQIPPSKAFLSKEDQEHVINCLLLDGYLKEDFHFTPYSTISYLVPGPRAPRLVNEPRDQPERADRTFRVEMEFRRLPAKGKRAVNRTRKETEGQISRKKRRKTPEVINLENEDEDV